VGNHWHGEGRIFHGGSETENKAPGVLLGSDQGRASSGCGKLTFVVEVYAPALHPTAFPEQAALVHKPSSGRRVFGLGRGAGSPRTDIRFAMNGDILAVIDCDPCSALARAEAQLIRAASVGRNARQGRRE
jgi:hypothetical protein